MASTLVNIAPSVHPAGTTQSAPFTMPSTTDHEIVVSFTVQQPDLGDPTKSLSCSLNDLTTGQPIASIAGWVGGSTVKGVLEAPFFGVTNPNDYAGHSLQFVLTLGASLNTGVVITTQ